MNIVLKIDTEKSTNALKENVKVEWPVSMSGTVSWTKETKLLALMAASSMLHDYIEEFVNEPTAEQLHPG